MLDTPEINRSAIEMSSTASAPTANTSVTQANARHGKPVVVQASGGRFTARIQREFTASQILAQHFDVRNILSQDESGAIDDAVYWPSADSFLKHFRVGFLRYLWPALALNGIGSPRERLRFANSAAVFSEFIRAHFEGDEIFHLHSVDGANLARFAAVPGDRLIISFWGSDLHRAPTATEHAAQQILVDKARLITVFSEEMCQFAKARFGDHIEEKLRIVKFGTSMLDFIDGAREGGAAAFRRDYQVRDDELVVMLGNNSSKGNQHLAAIESLSTLSDEQKAQFRLFIPCSYGFVSSTKPYLARVEQAARDAGLNTTMLHEHVSAEKLAEQRMGTDINLHLPEMDAFSHALLESLYAESVVITGQWLPYSQIRAVDPTMYSIASVSETASQLSEILQNIDQLKKRARENAQNIRSLAHWDEVTSIWIAVYREMEARATTHP